MARVLEILGSDLEWILADGETTLTTEDGIPEGASIVDAWWLDGVVYLQLDRDLDE